MSRIAHLDLTADFSFSAGHFTIFSATEREMLHGHNYQASLFFKINIEKNGLAFDYRYYKNELKNLCDQIDRRFLLPTLSPFLKITEEKEYYHAKFNREVIPFLKTDVILLPIENTTIEELSHWFLNNLTKDKQQLKRHQIIRMTIKIANGPGQAGGATWCALAN